MSIEIEERRFGITLEGAPYPPILSVDDNFETALSRSHDGRQGLARCFEDPIDILGRKPLVTLKDAADYILRLPETVQEAPEWQAAMECLILVAEMNGRTMMARIGVVSWRARYDGRADRPNVSQPSDTLAIGLPFPAEGACLRPPPCAVPARTA
jgi:hypothetical protein